jgi:hypothetical protein
MTTVDITFGFVSAPSENTLTALNALREVYGVRRLALDESARTVTVEFDATRLAAATVRGLLLRAGLDVVPSPAPAKA